MGGGDDESRLRQFCRVVEAATGRRAIRDNTMRANWGIRAEQGKPVELKSDLGDYEDARSLMLDVRQFLMKTERIYFPDICAIALRHLDQDPELIAATHQNRAMWEQVLRGRDELTLNGVTYGPLESFQLYAYGGVIHSDERKVAIWNGLPDFMRTMILAAVHTLIFQALQVAHAQRNVIEAGFARGSLRFGE